jgi:hypothetical protein
MPKQPKPIRQQARYDPNRGSAPPEMVDLVDPRWLLKALGMAFLVAMVCGVATLWIFSIYKAHHPHPLQPAQVTSSH